LQSPTAARLLAIITLLSSGAGRFSVLPLAAGSGNFMFEDTVPNANGDMVCMTALRGGPAFPNA